MRFVWKRENSFWTASLIIVGLNGTSAVITGVTAVLVARILGPRETGYLVWFITGTTTIAIFGDFLGVVGGISVLSPGI